MSWKNEQVSEAETEAIVAAARQCLVVPGDFVEMGCYRGDTSMVLAEILQGSEKKLWLYDSFEGLPEKEQEDESATGVDFEKGALAASKRELKQRFLRSGLAVPKIVKGWFSELTDEDLPAEIALGFLDGDFYQSTRDGLELIWPRLSVGGKLLVHDYANEALPGVAKAVEEYFEKAEEIKGVGEIKGIGEIEGEAKVEAKDAAKVELREKPEIRVVGSLAIITK